MRANPFFPSPSSGPERERGTAHPILSVPSPKSSSEATQDSMASGATPQRKARSRRNAGGVSACLGANKGPISHFIGAGHTRACQAHLKKRGGSLEDGPSSCQRVLGWACVTPRQRSAGCHVFDVPYYLAHHSQGVMTSCFANRPSNPTRYTQCPNVWRGNANHTIFLLSVQGGRWRSQSAGACVSLTPVRADKVGSQVKHNFCSRAHPRSHRGASRPPATKPNARLSC
jgi:hypothetical protein